ncbi:MAG: DUF2125 domain-containing protein, partial [Rhizobiales bacterium]|nr:DUF2125 domain-containing protein [Hyphomicrobiales bacterium]
IAVPLARAAHVELHTQFAASSTPDHPVIDVAVDLTQASVQDIHPALAQPFDALVGARLTGLRDFSPKPWPVRFREIQAADGKIRIERARIQQGNMIATAAGSLGLTPDGNLDGELQMTVAGFEQVIPLLGIEKVLEEGVPQATLDRLAPGVKAQDVNNLLGSLDRMIPGLGKVVRQNAGAGLAAVVNSLGTPAELEGKPARSFPLRFADGAVLLGPVKVGQVPPLF